jgi:hypothetical protein
MAIYTLNNAIRHYFDAINSYGGNKIDVKKADKHMDGFSTLIKSSMNKYIVREKHKAIISGRLLNKRWDLRFYNSEENNILEMKSLVLSKMGKCFSNRIEECIGVAYDIKSVSPHIKLHYFLLIEDDIYESRTTNKKLEKIFDFLYNINYETKLYHNTCGVLVNNKIDYKFIYNDFDHFTGYWK